MLTELPATIKAQAFGPTMRAKCSAASMAVPKLRPRPRLLAPVACISTRQRVLAAVARFSCTKTPRYALPLLLGTSSRPSAFAAASTSAVDIGGAAAAAAAASRQPDAHASKLGRGGRRRGGRRPRLARYGDAATGGCRLGAGAARLAAGAARFAGAARLGRLGGGCGRVGRREGVPAPLALAARAAGQVRGDDGPVGGILAVEQRVELPQPQVGGGGGGRLQAAPRRAAVVRGAAIGVGLHGTVAGVGPRARGHLDGELVAVGVGGRRRGQPHGAPHALVGGGGLGAHAVAQAGGRGGGAELFKVDAQLAARRHALTRHEHHAVAQVARRGGRRDGRARVELARVVPVAVYEEAVAGQGQRELAPPQVAQRQPRPAKLADHHARQQRGAREEAEAAPRRCDEGERVHAERRCREHRRGGPGLLQLVPGHLLTQHAAARRALLHLEAAARLLVARRAPPTAQQPRRALAAAAQRRPLRGGHLRLVAAALLTFAPVPPARPRGDAAAPALRRRRGRRTHGRLEARRQLRLVRGAHVDLAVELVLLVRQVEPRVGHAMARAHLGERRRARRGGRLAAVVPPAHLARLARCARQRGQLNVGGHRDGAALGPTGGRAGGRPRLALGSSPLGLAAALPGAAGGFPLGLDRRPALEGQHEPLVEDVPLKLPRVVRGPVAQPRHEVLRLAGPGALR
eukprot:scaffold112440_cov48-Phaeocystis_antarctica.AAC.1